MMNDHSCGIRIFAEVSFVLSQSTRLTDGQTVRRTNGRTDRKVLQYRALHYTQSHGKNLQSRGKTASFEGIDDASDSIIALVPVIGNNGSSE